MLYKVVPQINCNLDLFEVVAPVDSGQCGITTCCRPALTNLSTFNSSLQVSFWAYTCIDHIQQQALLLQLPEKLRNLSVSPAYSLIQ